MRGEIQRKNQKRVITLTGNEHGRALDQVLADVQAALDRVPLPSGYGLALTGENQEQKEAVVQAGRQHGRSSSA